MYEQLLINKTLFRNVVLSSSRDNSTGYMKEKLEIIATNAG